MPNLTTNFPLGFFLKQQCFTDNVLYQATIASDDIQQDTVYYGICETIFLKKIRKPS